MTKKWKTWKRQVEKTEMGERWTVALTETGELVVKDWYMVTVLPVEWDGAGEGPRLVWGPPPAESCPLQFNWHILSSVFKNLFNIKNKYIL